MSRIAQLRKSQLRRRKVVHLTWRILQFLDFLHNSTLVFTILQRIYATLDVSVTLYSCKMLHSTVAMNFVSIALLLN